MGLLPMDADILPPSDDRLFKRILTSPEAKPGLINLIAGIINRNVVDATLLLNEPPPESTVDKAERFDVNCKIDDGSQINLEMQASRMQEDLGGEHRNLKGKSIYYLTDLHSSQPAKGLRRYDYLAKTYQITFCSYTVFPKLPNYVNSFSMRHDVTGDLFSDAIQVTFIELSKLHDILRKPVSDMTALDKWAVFFQYASDPNYRKTVNQVIESEEVLTVAGNLLMSFSQDEVERAILRSRRKFQTDYQSDMATSWDNGFKVGEKRGEEKGEKRGEQKGERKRNLEVARTALEMNMPISDIVKLTGLTQTEIEKLTDECPDG